MVKFFRHGGTIAWMVVLGVMLAIVLSAKLLTDTAELRFVRDVNRMVFNDNLGVLNELQASTGAATDSMRKLLEAPAPASNSRYIVVSIADHRLWLRQGDSVLFQAPVATASGKELEGNGGSQHWHFETPRGRLVVQSKDSAPMWIPPDWYYVEQANKRGLGVVRMERGQSIGGYHVEGSDIVGPDGTPVPPPKEGRDVVVNGNIIIPPFGTNQRRYAGTLGTRRLDLGDGYGIHGTDEPSSIGHSVSHGCVRLRNEDVEQLYPMVPVGTAVYIY